MNFATITFEQPIGPTPTPILISVLPCWVAAGFLSPAEDHAAQRVDLMAQLIKSKQVGGAGSGCSDSAFWSRRAVIGQCRFDQCSIGR